MLHIYFHFFFYCKEHEKAIERLLSSLLRVVARIMSTDMSMLKSVSWWDGNETPVESQTRLEFGRILERSVRDT